MKCILHTMLYTEMFFIQMSSVYVLMLLGFLIRNMGVFSLLFIQHFLLIDQTDLFFQEQHSFFGGPHILSDYFLEIFSPIDRSLASIVEIPSSFSLQLWKWTFVNIEPFIHFQIDESFLRRWLMFVSKKIDDSNACVVVQPPFFMDCVVKGYS